MVYVVVVETFYHFLSFNTPCCTNHARNTTFVQVLLVFPYIDGDCGELQDACNRLEMHTYIAHSLSAAIESFQHLTNGGHNLIIVDGRSPHLLDPETVARYASYVVG